MKKPFEYVHYLQRIVIYMDIILKYAEVLGEYKQIYPLFNYQIYNNNNNNNNKDNIKYII